MRIFYQILCYIPFLYYSITVLFINEFRSEKGERGSRIIVLYYAQFLWKGGKGVKKSLHIAIRSARMFTSLVRKILFANYERENNVRVFLERRMKCSDRWSCTFGMEWDRGMRRNSFHLCQNSCMSAQPFTTLSPTVPDYRK